MIFDDPFNKLVHSFYNLVVLKTKVFSKETSFFFLNENIWEMRVVCVCVCVGTFDNLFFLYEWNIML